MPSPKDKKGRRGEANGDWDVGGTDESFVNGSHGNSSNQISSSGADEFGENDHGGNSSGRKPRQNKGGSSSQHKQKLGLGQWADDIDEAVQNLEVTNQVIKRLQGSLNSHLDDLRRMEGTGESLRQLQEKCDEKDEQITKQENVIETLTNMNSKAKEETGKKQRELDGEKSKQEKRVTAIIAEEKSKLRKWFDELVTDQGQSHDNRKKELEDEFTQKRRENNQRANALDVENKKLIATVKEQKGKIEGQAKALKKTNEDNDILNRAMDSFKRDKAACESELQMMKKEFALSTRSKDYFERRFAEIHDTIDGISRKYFIDIEGKDLVNVHKELGKADPCFESIPIDDSEDSRNLRIAHAQRIISGAICEIIWKPLRSELTVSDPNLDDLLVKIMNEVERSSQGGRVANVWTALTMHALQHLPANSNSSRASEYKVPFDPTGSSRADGVIRKVFSTLDPLISSSQKRDLRTELFKLAEIAIEVWNHAQSDELKIIVHPVLDSAHREEWRSEEFDPTLPSGDDETKSDIPSKTHTRIFTLFPRVVSQGASDPIQQEAGLPGSWPGESRQAVRLLVETCIHPGKGLPEWSSLVVRGKEEQMEMNDAISKAVEYARKEASNKRLSGHSRRESTGSSTSAFSPSSPSQQWNKGGAMKIPEK